MEIPKEEFEKIKNQYEKGLQNEIENDLTQKMIKENSKD